MKKHNKTKWLNMGPVIVHFGFCGSEKAYSKTMQKMGIDGYGDFIPSGVGSCVHVFDSDKMNRTILMCYDTSTIPNKTRNQVDSLIAHECYHVAQWCIDYMNEKPDAHETFAYIVQYVFGFVTNELWGDE